MVSPAAVRNYWPDAKCAKAFWSQQEVRPYRRLLADTLDWAAPASGEKWLDLGCGSGPLSAGLWERSGGQIAEVIGLDCASVNEQAYAKLRATLAPAPGERVRFLCHDFSRGLGVLWNASFDHCISGLSITYAESWSDARECWTTDAYDRVLAEVFRVLRRGGRFVFSVNVPEPKWWKVGLLSMGDILRAGRPVRFIKRALRMMKYGGWLKREARTGRFHYLPAAEITAKLAAAGFERIEHRLSYAGQAFVFRAHKPG
jgi:ubiquinone/menaquinone biosynthesis C-methylase UbiE